MDNTEDKVTVLDTKRYEMVEWEGKPARHYPHTGAVMVQDEVGRWIIRGNTGGREDFDGAAMVAARELKKEEAIIRGLEQAAWELDLRTATEMLSAIVGARARNAIEDEGRTGNADAKFIFSLISPGKEGDGEGPALRIDMDKDTAKTLVDRLLEI
jgi:hypothetical protein